MLFCPQYTPTITLHGLPSGVFLGYLSPLLDTHMTHSDIFLTDVLTSDVYWGALCVLLDKDMSHKNIEQIVLLLVTGSHEFDFDVFLGSLHLLHDTHMKCKDISFLYELTFDV